MPIGLVGDPTNRGSNLPAVVRTTARRHDARVGANRPRRSRRADVARSRRGQIHVHGAAAARSDHRERDARTVGAAGGDQPAVADRVHERREPAAGARGGARARSRDSRVARRGPIAAVRPGDGRDARARHHRQRCRHRPRVGTAAHLRHAGAGEFPASRGDRARCERAGLLAVHRGVRGPGRRPRAGDAPAALGSQRA